MHTIIYSEENSARNCMFQPEKKYVYTTIL